MWFIRRVILCSIEKAKKSNLKCTILNHFPGISLHECKYIDDFFNFYVVSVLVLCISWYICRRLEDFTLSLAVADMFPLLFILFNFLVSFSIIRCCSMCFLFSFSHEILGFLYHSPEASSKRPKLALLAFSYWSNMRISLISCQWHYF